MMDEDIDTSDIPPLDDTFFANATLRLPEKSGFVVVKVEPEVLRWFKSQGREWQDRMSAALRIYAQAHQFESQSE
jgi:uncharacterized protein (DUF4415 family)